MRMIATLKSSPPSLGVATASDTPSASSPSSTTAKLTGEASQQSQQSHQRAEEVRDLAAAAAPPAVPPKRKRSMTLPITAKATAPPAARAASASCCSDQFDDADDEDDLPLPTSTAGSGESQSSEQPPQPPSVTVKQEIPSDRSQPRRNNNNNDNNNKKSHDSSTDDESLNNKDSNNDSEALDTLALACIQERKERARIDEGGQVEQADVTRADVLCGRGGMTNHHAGNIFYRRVVRLKQEAYIAAVKREKIQIAADIVHIIRCLDPPGRFLRKDNNSSNWIEIGDKAAIAKTSQALREGAPDIRNNVMVGDQAGGDGPAPKLSATTPAGRSKARSTSGRKRTKQNRGGSESHQDEEDDAQPIERPKTAQRPPTIPPSSPPMQQQRAFAGPDASAFNFGQTMVPGHSPQTRASLGLDSARNRPPMLRVPPSIPIARMPPPHVTGMPRVAVIPPGCPLPPGAMLLTPAAHPHFLPFHPHHPMDAVAAAAAAAQLAASGVHPMFHNPFVSAIPPELVGSAGGGHKPSREMHATTHRRGMYNEEESDAEAEVDERVELGQQVSGSEGDDAETDRSEPSQPSPKKKRRVMGSHRERLSVGSRK